MSDAGYRFPRVSCEKCGKEFASNVIEPHRRECKKSTRPAPSDFDAAVEALRKRMVAS